ncbi:hypothetical protein R50072_28320 [Simiduia litorea]|uniref:hypothetical protein n=1 Tax=Simiduia litorea TaxID=1435348 RepID=UPI0036F33D44
MKTKYIFLISFSIPTLYNLFWHLARYLNFGLSNDFNIPSFFFLMLAMPWTVFAVEVGTLAKALLGSVGRNAITILIVGAGFAINITLMKICVSWLYNKYFKSNT